MDNLTHSLVGWTLGQAGLKRKTRKGLAALILGANAPDIDVFFGWAPWAPLSTHRGVTHSLVGGVLVLPILLAGLLWLLDRWQDRRGTEFKSGLPMRFGWLVTLSYLGCLTHPLLDWQNSYAVQFLSPFDNRWFHNDALFILDPWIWAGLGLAIWLSRRRERSEHYNWEQPAKVALAGMVAYIAGNGAVSSFVKNETQMSEPYANPDVIVATPPPVQFWRREVIWRQDGAIARGIYDPFRSPIGLVSYTPPEPDGMADTLARRAIAASPEVLDFMRWSLLPMAQVRRQGCTALVHFQDARFGRGPTVRIMSLAVEVPSGADGC